MFNCLQLRWICVALCLGMCGCGSDDTTSSSASSDDELQVLFAKETLYEFRAVVRAEGVAGARDFFPVMRQDFSQEPPAAYQETFQQVTTKLDELETALAGSPTVAELTAVADELATLADSLPGEADPNPDLDY